MNEEFEKEIIWLADGDPAKIANVRRISLNDYISLIQFKFDQIERLNTNNGRSDS